MITNIGLDSIISCLNTTYNYLAIGNGNTPVAINDTELNSELYREETTNTINSSSINSNTINYYSRFIISNNSVIKELGLFSANSGGDMFFRKVISDIIVKDGYKLDVFVEVSVSESE